MLGEHIRHVGEVGETAAGHVRLHVGQRFLYKTHVESWYREFQTFGQEFWLKNRSNNGRFFKVLEYFEKSLAFCIY
jgi:hypothetical protein